MLVLGELELGWRLLPNEVIAITGSNGKTTTTELVGQMHREAGLPVAVAGNVGTALTPLAGSLDPGAIVVCEASSFQLEDTLAFAPDAAVLLNLAPDHLDRHGTLRRLPRGEAADLRPPGRGRGGGRARGPRAGGGARRVAFVAAAAPGPHGPTLAVRDGAARLARRAGRRRRRDPAARRAQPGERDGRGGRRARARRRPRRRARRRCAGFAGVAAPARGGRADRRRALRRRLQGHQRGLRGRRASARSTAACTRSSAAAARARTTRRSSRAVAERCRAAYLIGEEAERLRAALEPTGVPLRDCGDLEHAVAAARARRGPGDVVLLSPACASYDQYRSFEERGEHFKALGPRLTARRRGGRAAGPARRRAGPVPSNPRSDGRDPGSSRSSTACS